MFFLKGFCCFATKTLSREGFFLTSAVVYYYYYVA